MGRILGLALLALVGLLLAGCAASSPPAAPAVGTSSGPRLAFDQRSLDFGDVQFKQQVDASFTAKNVGDRPLTISKVDVKTVEGC